MRPLPAAILSCVVLAGCSTVALNPAPVVSTSATPVGATPAPAASAVALAALPPGSYRVQRGDTLRSIAHRFGHSWQELAGWNQLSNPNVIEVGQVLRVVPPSTSAAPAAVASSGPGAAQTFALAPLGASASAPASRPQPAAARSTPAASAPARHVASAATAASAPKSVASAAAPTAHAGGLVWAWPAQGRVLKGFNGSTSKGLDIAGDAGDPVRAAAGGKVVYAGNELRGFGNLVIVKHDTEYISVYAHNQKLLVKDGQDVHRGQTIALMGSSDAPRVELHFEVRLRGKPIDPTQVLPAR